MRRLLAGVLVVGALAAAAPASASPSLDVAAQHRVLRAKLLVPGRTVGLPALAVSSRQSSSLSAATIDLCGAKPPSERLRTAREERYYLSSSVGLDVEVAAYKPGGTARVETDVRAIVARTHGTCHDRGHLITGLRTAPPPAGSLVHSLYVVGDLHLAGGGIDHLTELYQMKDDVLSIVYTQGFDARVTTVARRVQRDATSRLRHGAADVPG